LHDEDRGVVVVGDVLEARRRQFFTELEAGKPLSGRKRPFPWESLGLEEASGPAHRKLAVSVNCKGHATTVTSAAAKRMFDVGLAKVVGVS